MMKTYKFASPGTKRYRCNICDELIPTGIYGISVNDDFFFHSPCLVNLTRYGTGSDARQVKDDIIDFKRFERIKDHVEHGGELLNV